MGEVGLAVCGSRRTVRSIEFLAGRLSRIHGDLSFLSTVCEILDDLRKPRCGASHAVVVQFLRSVLRIVIVRIPIARRVGL